MKLIIILMLMMLIPIAAADNVTYPNTTQLTDAGAFDTINNMENVSSIQMNLTEYSFLNSVFTWDHNKTDFENGMRIVGAPYNEYWVGSSGMGYWFYVALIFLTIIMVYGKSKSLEVTSIITMLLSMLVIVPSLASMIIVPVPVLVILGVFATLAFAAVLLSLFGDE